MIDNPAASNVLGTIGTIMWCLQIVPQIVKNYRSQSTYGLSPWLLVCWASASVPQGAYLLIEWVSVPLLIQPQIFAALALVGVGQCFYYRDGGEQVGSKFTRWQASLCVLAAMIVYGGVEFAFFELGRLGKRRGTDAASQVFGILGVIGILGGLVPQYWEIYRIREVVGISLLLLLIDSAGAVFSLLALIFKPEFDGLAAANYIGILALEFGIFALRVILNPRAAKKRRLLAESEKPTPCETASMRSVAQAEEGCSSTPPQPEILELATNNGGVPAGTPGDAGSEKLRIGETGPADSKHTT